MIMFISFDFFNISLKNRKRALCINSKSGKAGGAGGASRRVNPDIF